MNAIKSEEAVSLLTATLTRGIHFSSGRESIVAAHGSTVIPFTVAHRGSSVVVRVVDDGLRPPSPGGSWVDDKISAACRHVFGVTRGTCRKIQGEERFEFREFWHDPTRYKVIENVKVEYAPAMQRPSDTIKVETSAYPGADVASVVFASAYQCLERKFGSGDLSWVPNKDCVLRFEANPHAIVNTLVPCRYTIITNGGRSQEIVTYVPGDLTRDWDALRAAITAKCRIILGPGTLSYSPEHGECTFSYK